MVRAICGGLLTYQTMRHGIVGWNCKMRMKLGSHWENVQTPHATGCQD